jgi:hypothetical protein
VNPLPEVRDPRPSRAEDGQVSAPRQPEPVVVGRPARSGSPATWWRRLRYPLGVYAATRVLYLIIALVDTVARHDTAGRHWTLAQELANWDGRWYLLLSTFGYPQHLSAAQSTLGFFPLYPGLMWLLTHTFGTSYELSGLLIALLTGAAATVLIGRLAAAWWDEAAARRATLFFCVFPGSIVFSMVYTEGLLIMLVAGCLLALGRRRWVLGGVLAGLSTAVGPVAVGIIPACALAALLELRRAGWTWRDLRPAGAAPDALRRAVTGLRPLVAPLLAPLGVIGLGVFMWVWTGTPTAIYQTQRDDWHETSTPLAVPRIVESLAQQIQGTDPIRGGVINLNDIAGLLGAGFLVWALVLMWRHRARIPPAAVVWTLAIGLLTVTSNATPPNARMLISAFPALLVVAAALRGHAFRWLIGVTLVLCVAMSAVTFVTYGLRP